jgi:hypothetical protein
MLRLYMRDYEVGLYALAPFHALSIPCKLNPVHPYSLTAPGVNP